MSNSVKPLQFVVSERKATVGAHKDQIVQVAIPTGRERVSFRALAEETSRNLTFSAQEIMACVNELTAIAKMHVENGDIVELGDLGTLSPSFKSKAVPQDEEFRAQTHIYAPRVTFRANRKYFALSNRNYERTVAIPLKGKKSGASSAGGSSAGKDSTGSTSGGGSVGTGGSL